MDAISALKNHIRVSKQVKVLNEKKISKLLTKATDFQLRDFGSTFLISYSDLEPAFIAEAHYPLKDENGVVMFNRNYYQKYLAELISNYITQQIMNNHSGVFNSEAFNQPFIKKLSSFFKK